MLSKLLFYILRKEAYIFTFPRNVLWKLVNHKFTYNSWFLTIHGSPRTQYLKKYYCINTFERIKKSVCLHTVWWEYAVLSQDNTDVKNKKFSIRLALICWTGRVIFRSLIKVRIYSLQVISIFISNRNWLAYFCFFDFYKRKYIFKHFFSLILLCIFHSCRKLFSVIILLTVE